MVSGSHQCEVMEGNHFKPRICIRHSQYCQIAYQKFLIAKICIKKYPEKYIFFFTKVSYHDIEVNFLVLR